MPFSRFHFWGFHVYIDGYAQLAAETLLHLWAKIAQLTLPPN